MCYLFVKILYQVLFELRMKQVTTFYSAPFRVGRPLIYTVQQKSHRAYSLQRAWTPVWPWLGPPECLLRASLSWKTWKSCLVSPFPLSSCKLTGAILMSPLPLQPPLQSPRPLLCPRQSARTGPEIRCLALLPTWHAKFRGSGRCVPNQLIQQRSLYTHSNPSGCLEQRIAPNFIHDMCFPVCAHL